MSLSRFLHRGKAGKNRASSRTRLNRFAALCRPNIALAVLSVALQGRYVRLMVGANPGALGRSYA